ncbi:hypothetical protein M911_07780 [Ectothiorhodospira haloalkaliphila]|uniref:PEP-CTERM protein-sorting domain-containing protein n=1 Tax=Ectothiorhodospira haloalkaliphila TaxID=421628 RepID=W8KUK5_9GAMM|nr:PEP-CTERM sorting domain-containing protein [Ectothiorhodospira haloalkaliphila]AHK80667.1 hypothetical protein M911_07780 [Ectothiorhodospira haloalkaliphila]
MLVARSFVMLALVFASQAAHAIPIQYELQSLGGSEYRYEYTITNDRSLEDEATVEWFTIFFEAALYDENSLYIVTADPPAAEWDEVILASAPLVDPAYDAFARAGGIAVDETVTGFKVQFAWLGSGTPGPQPFEIYDSTTFEVLFEGSTEPRTTAIPEPGSLVLVLVGAIAAFAASLRRTGQAA